MERTFRHSTVGDCRGKKKNFGKECSGNKHNREKRTQIETNHGQGSNNQKGRGCSRGIATKETSLQSEASRDKSEDLDMAEAEGQEGS